MKKFMFFAVMVMFAVVANAQVITDMDVNFIYLSNGTKVRYSDLPDAHYHAYATIDQCIAETAYNKYAEEAKHYRLPVGAGYGAGYYGAYPVYGGESSSFSIGNEHWGVSSSSSNYGGYKTSGTGIRIGSFHIGTSKSGYTQPSYNNGTSYEAAPTASQKKADAKAAAQRYSQMKATGVTRSSSNGNSNSNTTLKTNSGTSVLLY